MEKKATKGSNCKISHPECLKMTNFDTFHREAVGGGGGLGAYIMYQIIQ